jgi:hypothetical protein
MRAILGRRSAGRKCLSRVFRFEDIREAHRVMGSIEAGGKLVVVHD